MSGEPTTLVPKADLNLLKAFDPLLHERGFTGPLAAGGHDLRWWARRRPPAQVHWLRRELTEDRLESDPRQEVPEHLAPHSKFVHLQNVASPAGAAQYRGAGRRPTKTRP
jgi:hypothetical protein